MSTKKPETTEAAPLSAGERLHVAGRVIRALSKLPQATQRDVLSTVAVDLTLIDALRGLTNILHALAPEDRAAVVRSATELVGGGA
jgi:hypothetical protein